MKTRILVLIGLMFILFVMVNLFGKDRLFKNIPKTDIPDNTPTEGTFCTQDAKMCSDGSYVGRVGPNCEFADCPLGNGSKGDIMQITMGQTGKTEGVTIIPLEILEDSRCPVDVVCIQAGTVRLRATFVSATGTVEQIFVLNQPIITEAQTVELVEVKPSPTASKLIRNQDYNFVFKVSEYIPEQI